MNGKKLCGELREDVGQHDPGIRIPSLLRKIWQRMLKVCEEHGGRETSKATREAHEDRANLPEDVLDHCFRRLLCSSAKVVETVFL